MCLSCNKGEVYICKGPQSHAYHKTKLCQGLKRCSTDIKAISKTEATNSLNRDPCSFCYKNNN